MIMLKLKNRMSYILSELKTKRSVDTSEKKNPPQNLINIHIVYITEFYFYS